MLCYIILYYVEEIGEKICENNECKISLFHNDCSNSFIQEKI